MKNRIGLLIVLLYTSCTAEDPFVSTFELKDKWELTEVFAPSYPFDSVDSTNTISISFPKNEEYELDLSTFTCGGTYLAKQSGSIQFKRSNCTEACCMSDYDLYIFTLLKKINTFKYIKEDNLQLFINEDNYLTFEYSGSTDVF